MLTVNKVSKVYKDLVHKVYKVQQASKVFKELPVILERRVSKDSRDLRVRVVLVVVLKDLRVLLVLEQEEAREPVVVLEREEAQAPAAEAVVRAAAMEPAVVMAAAQDRERYTWTKGHKLTRAGRRVNRRRWRRACISWPRRSATCGTSRCVPSTC